MSLSAQIQSELSQKYAQPPLMKRGVAPIKVEEGLTMGMTQDKTDGDLRVDDYDENLLNDRLELNATIQFPKTSTEMDFIIETVNHRTSIFPKDADNRLSHSKLLYHIDINHPREITYDTKGKAMYTKHPICRTSTGWPCCTRKSRESDLSQYGAGLVLYFQFIKFLILVYAGLFILSLPCFVLYFSGNAFSNTAESEFKNFLAQFTIGNIGQASSACNSAQMVTTTNPESINLFCTFGTLDKVLDFGQTLVASNPVCKSDLYFTPERCSYTGGMSKVSKERLESVFKSNCMGKMNCSITLDTTMVPNNCTTGYQRKDLIYFMQAACTVESIEVFKDGWFSIFRGDVGLIVVSIDIVIVVSLFAALFFLKDNQERVAREIDNKEVTAKDFTVELRNIPKSTLKTKEFKATLWEWIETQCKQRGPQLECPDTQLPDEYQDKLMQVSFGLSDFGRLELLEKMRKLIKEEKKIRRAIAAYPEKQYEYQEETLTINQMKMEVIAKLDEHDRLHTTSECVVAFAQFQSMNGAQKFRKALRLSKWIQLFNGSMHEDKKFQGAWLDIKKAPEPEVINWENYTVTKSSRIIRNLISILITCILLLLSLGAVATAQYFSNSAQEGYETDQCANTDGLTMSAAYEDYLRGKKGAGLLGCYCLEQLALIQTGVKDITFPNGKKLCYNWFEGYTMSTAMALTTALVVELVNEILIATVSWTAGFLKFFNKSEELSSCISKMFIFEFINTALVIILVNAQCPFWDMPQNAPILAGKYDDFTVQWYRNVGVTLHFTMMLYIVSSPLISYGLMLPAGLLRWWDRGFQNKDLTKTRQVMQEDYEELYMGSEFPIEERYAKILNTFFVTMMLSPGMPTFYLIGFLDLMFLYWFDKIIVLRQCKTPPRYSQDLNKAAVNTMMYGVILHLPFAFLMYSYTEIFSDRQTMQELADSLVSSKNSILTQIFQSSYRVEQPHARVYMWACVAIFLLFVIYKVTVFLLDVLNSTLEWSPLKACLRSKAKIGAKLTPQQALKAYTEAGQPCFSNNLYQEITIEGLKSEYSRTKDEQKEYLQEVKSGAIQKDLVKYFYSRNDMKIKIIKGLVTKWQKESKMELQRLNTLETFDKLFPLHVGDLKKHRMRSLYSYDVRDHETFRHTFKVEAKIREFKESRKAILPAIVENVGTPKFPGQQNNFNESRQELIPLNTGGNGIKSDVLEDFEEDKNAKTAEKIIINESNGPIIPSPTPRREGQKTIRQKDLESQRSK
ncbi:hypothetical protein FGO68_gene17344 [Halteria grandinella]|uniref:CSC1/OSCA1-like cytosolic domain-containing protein n=1 Tax=Halteria grandinella TaxID=5974 RepID=A0A8J8P368_HALGN|nr:hypothetical protein FGO68_gene17344 [Halteria grandinella]